MLSKALIPLAFWQGLDTKRDKKQQLYGTLRKAENVVFETLGSARKRNGYDAIALQNLAGGGSITAEYLAAFRQELLAFTNTTLYSYSASLGKLQERGAVYSVFPTSHPVVNNGLDNIQVDMLVVGGLKVFAYVRKHPTTAALNEVRYAVQDSTNQTMLVSDDLVVVNAAKPRLSYINDKVYIFYASGTNIYFRTFNIAVPGNLDVQKTFATNLSSANSVFEVIAAPPRITVAYGSTDLTNRLYLNTVTYNDSIGTSKQVAEAGALTALEMYIDTGARVVVSYSTASAVKYIVYNSALVALPGFSSPVTVEAQANVVSIVVAEIQPNSYNIYYTVSEVLAYNYRIRSNNVTSAAIVGTASSFLRSVSLATKSFIVDGNSYFTVSYESQTQPTYYVVNTNGVVVTKISAGIAGGRVQSTVLPDVYVNGTEAIVASLYKTRLVSDNGNFYSLNGVQNTVLEFANVNRFQNATLNNNMIIGGGVVQMYDGDVIAEQGFNVYPEKPVLVATGSFTPNNNGGVAAMLPGTYYYSAVYKWTDQYGQEHRSAPSEELEVVLASPNNSVKLDIPTLRLTQKADVTIELYRTEGSLSGSILYLVNEATIPFNNNPAVDTVQFIDGLPDYTGTLPNEILVLANRRTLYTTGGVLDNVAAPSAKIVATHTASQRIFLAGLEQPNELLYSKIAFPGQPVEFNDALRMVVDPIGGRITALASMDEKLIIFKEDATMFVAGIGPNNLGQQDSFTRPERVSIDIGCVEPKSIVLTPDGLMFKSRKGIFLLSRQLGMSYIGAPVEEFNNLTITSAKVIGELNQVRFTTIDGDTLVYNYVFQFWATFTNHRARAAEVIGNDYYYLRKIEDGVLYKENRTSYSDGGTSIKMRLEIGWISFAVLQGYGRVYKMMLLGDWYSNHNLLVQVGYDFKEPWTQQALITPGTAGLEATAYGLDSPYGSGSPYGGQGNPYQARVDFKQQKCQSMKLLIEDVQESAGQGFSLSQITFEVGGKTGLFKVAKGKKFGTT